MVKYIANRPAKNISSLLSHTIVPTLTMFGRVSEWTRLDSNRAAVADEVTFALCPSCAGVLGTGSRCFRAVIHGRPGQPSGLVTMPAMTHSASGPAPRSEQPVTVLVYSNSADVRAQVRRAVGRRPAPDVGRIDWVECATNFDLVEQLDEGGIDLLLLDGEAQPTGGMGLARQFKNEYDDCPPIVVLIARRQDGWLASWSLADAVIAFPLDPIQAADVVADQLRRHATGIPVVR
jgi:CheY-like chemotaxis protein